MHPHHQCYSSVDTGPQRLLGMWELGCPRLPTAHCSCASTGPEHGLRHQGGWFQSRLCHSPGVSDSVVDLSANLAAARCLLPLTPLPRCCVTDHAWLRSGGALDCQGRGVHWARAGGATSFLLG